jgi:hypothetical protein
MDGRAGQVCRGLEAHTNQNIPLRKAKARRLSQWNLMHLHKSTHPLAVGVHDVGIHDAVIHISGLATIREACQRVQQVTPIVYCGERESLVLLAKWASWFSGFVTLLRCNVICAALSRPGQQICG